MPRGMSTETGQATRAGSRSEASKKNNHLHLHIIMSRKREGKVQQNRVETD
jgi:hypothetical protein